MIFENWTEETYNQLILLIDSYIWSQQTSTKLVNQTWKSFVFARNKQDEEARSEWVNYTLYVNEWTTTLTK